MVITMKKQKIMIFITVALISAMLLSVPAFAATDTGWSSDNQYGFLDSIASFFMGLLKGILSGLSSLLDGIGIFIANAVKHILDGLKALFIPSPDAFTNFQNDISVRFEAKFGPVTAAFDYLGGRFKNLREYNDLPGVFKVTFPKNSILYGMSVNFLSVAAPVLAFIRLAMTGFCGLMTGLICYNKVIKMINT